MTLGGRAAEELVFGEVTTGASNDIEKVTATAKQMVMRFGMSEKLGPRVFGHDHGQPFLGREFSCEPDYSDDVAREIDDEIRRVVEEAHQAARDVLDAAQARPRPHLRDPAAARDDRARGVHPAARRQVRGGGLRARRAGAAPGHAAGRARGAGAQARAQAVAAAAARPGRRHRGHARPRGARKARPAVVRLARALQAGLPAVAWPLRWLLAFGTTRRPRRLDLRRPRGRSPPAVRDLSRRARFTEHSDLSAKRHELHRDGSRERDARLVLRRRAVSRSGCGGRARDPAGRRGRGDPRRRRRVHAAGRRAGPRGGGAAAGDARGRGARGREHRTGRSRSTPPSWRWPRRRWRPARRS